MIGLFGPEIGMGLVKPDILGRMLGGLMNIEPGVIPTEEEVDQMKKALAKQAQAMQAQGQPQQ